MRLFALLAVLLLLVGCYATARAEGPSFEPGVVLVRWGTPVGITAQASTLSTLQARTVDSIPALGMVKLRVPPGTERATVAALRKNGAEAAGLNYVRRATQVPDDPRYIDQWALQRISSASAWDITTGSSSIIVAVIDTGIDTSHPDRPQNLMLGADYIVDSSGNTLVSGDPQGHGTHVAGIIAARMNNGTGVTGIAPGVTLMAIRVLDASGSGDTFTTAKGITYAVDHGAKVINLSLSGDTSDSAEEAAVNYAYSKGAMLVAAAGNCYQGGGDCNYLNNPVMYPAALDHVVAVAATTYNDKQAYYSETGPYIDLAAPGGAQSTAPTDPRSDLILSTCSGATYCNKAGTSMASPYVAGVAALVWSVNPSLSPDQVETILRQSAVDLGTAGRDDVFGYGRVNAYQAAVKAQTTLGSPTGYVAQSVSQSFPVTMTVGQQISASLQILNTGGVTWQQGTMRLGTSRPQDRDSAFYTAGNWISATRPATMDQATVAPGQTGRFAFILTAPSAGGTFTEYFQPVVEGLGWMQQPVVSFQVHVLLPPQPNKLYFPLLARQSSGW